MHAGTTIQQRGGGNSGRRLQYSYLRNCMIAVSTQLNLATIIAHSRDPRVMSLDAISDLATFRPEAALQLPGHYFATILQLLCDYPVTTLQLLCDYLATTLRLLCIYFATQLKNREVEHKAPADTDCHEDIGQHASNKGDSCRGPGAGSPQAQFAKARAWALKTNRLVRERASYSCQSC